MGGVILVLGSVQFIARLRERLPALHRWLGRACAIAALLAGLGGLGFIVVKGTIARKRLAAGALRVEVTVRDAAGNTSVVAGKSFRVRR